MLASAPANNDYCWQTHGDHGTFFFSAHSDDYNQMRTEDEGENNQRGSENKNGKDTVSTCTGICCDHKNGHGMEVGPTVSPNVSANGWLTVGQQFTDCRWTVGRLLGYLGCNQQ